MCILHSITFIFLRLCFIYIHVYVCKGRRDLRWCLVGSSSFDTPSHCPLSWSTQLRVWTRCDFRPTEWNTYIYMYICMYVCKTISTHYFVWLFFSVVLLLFNPWEKLHMGPLDNSTTAWHKRKLNVMVATETIPPTVGIVFICHQHHQTMCYYQYCMQTAGSW